MSDIVQYEVHGRVGVITLNRPDARNAVNGDVASGVEAAIAAEIGRRLLAAGKAGEALAGYGLSFVIGWWFGFACLCVPIRRNANSLTSP